MYSDTEKTKSSSLHQIVAKTNSELRPGEQICSHDCQILPGPQQTSKVNLSDLRTSLFLHYMHYIQQAWIPL